MNRLRRILDDFWGSFYNPGFYAQVPTLSSGRAFVCLTIIATITAAYAGFVLNGAMNELRGTPYMQNAAALYPEELVIEVKNGEASANVAQPYMIAMPGEGDATSSPQYLAVIDTRSEATVAEVAQYDAVMVLTQKALYMKGDDEQRVMDLRDIGDATLDRATVEDFAQKLQPIISGILYVLPLFAIVVIVLVLLTFWSVIAVLGAFIVMLIAKAKGLSYSFGASYTTALFALIPVTLIHLALGAFDVGLPFLAYVLIFAVVLIINIRKEQSPVPLM